MDHPYSFDLNFARDQAELPGSARFRVVVEDFCVREELEPGGDGRGNHLWLQIRKSGHNTPWVARAIAELARVDLATVGYCGLKDRRAQTTQWFSVPVSPAHQASLLAALPRLPGCELLRHQRNGHKLRRGMHSANRFDIRLRDVAGDATRIEDRLLRLGEGVPNYFGEQRFGIGGANLLTADIWLGRDRQPPRGGVSLQLSAARAYLFNLVLSERVRRHCWRAPLPGETEASGPLWGRGRNPAPPPVAALEAQVLEPWARWRDGLEHKGLRQDRRPLLLRPADWGWHWHGRDLVLGFSLPPGGYATVVLRELVSLATPAGATEAML